MWSKSHNPTLPSELKKWHIVRTSYWKWKIIDSTENLLVRVLLENWTIIKENSSKLVHIKAPKVEVSNVSNLKISEGCGFRSKRVFELALF